MAWKSQNFRKLFEAAPVGMLLVNRRGDILLANSSIEKIFGYVRDEIIGHSVEMLVPETLRSVHANYREAFFNSPTTKRMGVGRDLCGVCRDGSSVAIEIGLSPFTLNKETVVLVTVIDVTERKLQEGTRALLTAVVGSSTEDACVCHTADGIVQTWNASALSIFGYTAEEMIGKPISFLTPADRQDEEARLQEQLKRQECISPSEAVGLRKDGQQIDLLVSIRNVRDANGVLLGAARRYCDVSMSALYQDVLLESKLELEELNDALKARTEELSRSNEGLLNAMHQREDFIAALTHDLKNPLIGCNRILAAIGKGQVPDLDERKRLLSLISNSNDAMLRMIWNVLDTYKHDLGVLKPSLNRLNLIALLEACIEEFSFEIQTKQLEFRLNIPTEFPDILADRILLRRALTNLLDNAVKFTPEHGAISITATFDQKAVSLCIQDSGVGIPNDQRKHIFDCLWQGTAGLEAETGSGLGLRLARNIAESHRGSLVCEAAGEIGAAFKITLPIFFDDSNGPPSEP